MGSLPKRHGAETPELPAIEKRKCETAFKYKSFVWERQALILYCPGSHIMTITKKAAKFSWSHFASHRAWSLWGLISSFFIWSSALGLRSIRCYITVSLVLWHWCSIWGKIVPIGRLCIFSYTPIGEEAYKQSPSLLDEYEAFNTWPCFSLS